MPFKTAATLTALVAAVTVIAVAAGSDEPSTTRRAIVQQRELPDQAPGRPAQPTPGAPPSAPIRTAIATVYQVNVDSAGANVVGDAANEPSIAVDPTNPNRMAVGWRQFDTIASNFRQAGWAYTDDGGRTWTFPGVIEPGIFRSDPVLGFDAEGNFYYNSLKVIGGVYSCQVFKSANGGREWGPAVEAFGGDKQWMTIDRTGGMGGGNVYQAWNTAAGCCADTTFNRSTDGSVTYEYPVRIPRTPIFGTLDVDSEGNLYLVGIDPEDMSFFWVVKSSNAKDPMAVPAFDWSSWAFMNGSMVFGGAPGGPNPGGLLGQAWLAVDRSGGPHDGNIYVLCSVDPPGDDPLDIHFIRSTDDGVTWSLPLRINDDESPPYRWQWFGTMSVAPNGRIDVVWNDTRVTGDPVVSAMFYSYSTDGGVTWSANQQISPTFNSHLGWPNQNKLGDYYDMVSDDVGVSVAWAATFNNEQDVYYTRIGDYDCNVNGVPDSLDIATMASEDLNDNGIPDECEVPNLSAVAFTAFQARVVDGGVELSAEIAADGDRLRVDVYRGDGGPAALYNSVDHRAGETFRFVDRHVVPGETYDYYLAAEDGDGRFVSPTTTVSIPALEAVLMQNTPNPFNPVTTIRFMLPAAQHVELSIYDGNGRMVARLLDEPRSAGAHDVEWNGTDHLGNRVGSGVYFYRLTVGKKTYAKKMILLK